ncbi:MAG: nuclear transport factor 2 family protein [Pseudomonadota bacterium]
MNRMAALIVFLPYLAAYVLLGLANNTAEQRHNRTALATQLERSSLKRQQHAPLGIRLTPVAFAEQITAPDSQLGSSLTVERQLRLAIDRLGQAFQRRDRNSLEPMLTRDYLHINGDSGTVLDRARWLEWIDSEQHALRGRQLTIDRYNISDVEIRLHGSSAFVTGVVVTAGTRNGQPFMRQLRVSNFWVLTDGQWRRAGFHDAVLGTT